MCVWDWLPPEVVGDYQGAQQIKSADITVLESNWMTESTGNVFWVILTQHKVSSICFAVFLLFMLCLALMTCIDSTVIVHGIHVD